MFSALLIADATPLCGWSRAQLHVSARPSKGRVALLHQRVEAAEPPVMIQVYAALALRLAAISASAPLPAAAW